MAAQASGDSSNGENSSASTNTAKFFFRPSALSDVADKMWKKANVDSTSSSSTNGGQINLFTASALSSSSSGNNLNPFLTITSTTTSSPFIFGRNIGRRVVNASGDADGGSASSEASKSDTIEKESDTTSLSAQRKDVDDKDAAVRTEISFDSLAATSTTTDTVASSNGSASATSTTSIATASILDDTSSKLEESAAALEAAKHQTQKQPHLLAPGEVKTGEEDEMNVVQATVKLYVFDATKQSYTDRGLAVMRVNDRRTISSDGMTIMETRIVVRLQGSLRVIVNTKLWPGMLLERVSQKRLRLSGMVEDSIFSGAAEAEQLPPISIYLISGSQSGDVDRIERALSDRLARLNADQQEASTSRKRPMADSDTSSSSGISDQDDVSPAKKREFQEENKE